jgi:hypothetical protein
MPLAVSFDLNFVGRKAKSANISQQKPQLSANALRITRPA